MRRAGRNSVRWLYVRGWVVYKDRAYAAACGKRQDEVRYPAIRLRRSASASGRQRQAVTIGCGRSAPILSR